MNWTELKVTTTTEAIEVVSDILMTFGASGVQIIDENTITDYECDPFGEILDKKALQEEILETQVIAYFPETISIIELLPSLKAKITELSTFGFSIGKAKIEVNNVDDENWADAWKKYYAPKRITRFLTVVPSWVTYEKESSDELLITLDPGMAFGTGTHPTTKLTLQALEQTIRGNEVVLDVGCGSGVLSIASSLLGAKKIHAFDLDEVATKQAQENFDLNPTLQNIVVSTGNLLQGVTQKADIICANILADILILMIEDAKKLLNENGTLIMSGIISEKLELVMSTLHAHDFVVAQTLTIGEWNALIIKHPTDELTGVVGG